MVSDSHIFARALRRRMTSAERLLWKKLRNRQLGGVKFRRQTPIGVYIVDFYCPSCRLIIEVDGGIHALQKEYDAIREDWLRSKGNRVIRFENHVVLGSVDAVLQTIMAECIRYNPHLNPLP